MNAFELKCLTDIVCKTLEKQPATDVPRLVAQLREEICNRVGTLVVPAKAPSEDTVLSQEMAELQRRNIDSLTQIHQSMLSETRSVPEPPPAQGLSLWIEAPFPSSALGNDGDYDPVKATALLPSFNKLKREWQDGYSVIKIDEQTVVMSSCHYVDLLTIRDKHASEVLGESRSESPLGGDVSEAVSTSPPVEGLEDCF